MITHSFLDEIKDNYQDILRQKSSQPVNIDDLAINYSASLESEFFRHLALLHAQMDLLARAKRVDDELVMQSALLKMRTHAMSLSSFFDAIVEDTEAILRSGEWPEIPENYRVPEH